MFQEATAKIMLSLSEAVYIHGCGRTALVLQ